MSWVNQPYRPTRRVKVTDTVDNLMDGIPGGLAEASLGDTSSLGTDDTPEGETHVTSSSTSEIPDNPKEAEKGYLRQADYTRKTQEVAELRRELQAELTQAKELRSLMLQGNQGAPQAEQPAVEAVELPDPKVDAKGYIEGYIAQRVKAGVQDALENSGLKGLRDEVSPLLQRERLGSEYQKFMADSPELDHTALSSKAGALIDADPALTQLASSDPRLAIRLATQLAQARVDVDRAKKKNASRREAAPLAARNASTVNGSTASTIDDAFRLALQQQGVEPGF
jgi:hypothetical protein